MFLKNRIHLDQPTERQISQISEVSAVPRQAEMEIVITTTMIIIELIDRTNQIIISNVEFPARRILTCLQHS